MRNFGVFLLLGKISLVKGPIEYNRERRIQYISPFLQEAGADKFRSRGFGYIKMEKSVFDILDGDFERFKRIL